MVQTSVRNGSGEPAADRRVDFAEMLFGSGDPAAAAEIMLGALELAPRWALGWLRLGEFQEAAGDMAAAVVAWRAALSLDPRDRAGASLKLSLAGAQSPAAAPAAFVEALFDEYAPDFDAALAGRLGYRVPQLLQAAIDAAAPGRRFARALDLGCGTGLMGERLRPVCAWLGGVDLSAGMLARAAARRIYDRLAQADLTAHDAQGQTFDLVTAADVFIYVGPLEQALARIAALLEPGGLLGFSVERLFEGDLRLQPSRRYAHSRDYLERQVAEAGLAMISIAEDTIRLDRGEPVPGLIVVAGK